MIRLEVNPATGGVRIVSNDTTPGQAASYDIASASNSLNSANLNSLADQGVPGWSELLANDAEITEDHGTTGFAFDATGYGLGAIFRPNGTRDLALVYFDQNFNLVTGNVTCVLEPASISALPAVGLTLRRRHRRA